MFFIILRKTCRLSFLSVLLFFGVSLQALSVPVSDIPDAGDVAPDGFAPLSVTLKVTARAANLKPGDNILLQWESDDAVYCTGNWTKNTLSASGESRGTAKRSRTFTITCYDEDGNQASDSVTISVFTSVSQESGAERLKRLARLITPDEAYARRFALIESARKQYLAGKSRDEAKLVVRDYAFTRTDTVRCPAAGSECGQDAQLHLEDTWDEAAGGRLLSQETLTLRYGGAVCSVVTTWAPEPWPPKQQATSVTNGCDGKDGTEVKTYLPTDKDFFNRAEFFQPFSIPRLENGTGVVARQVADFPVTDIAFNARTDMSLDIAGDSTKRYAITLAAAASEIYDFPLATASYRQLGRSEYTVADKAVDKNGQVTVIARGGDRIDVTPRAPNAKYYVFDVAITAIKELSSEPSHVPASVSSFGFRAFFASVLEGVQGLFGR